MGKRKLLLQLRPTDSSRSVGASDFYKKVGRQRGGKGLSMASRWIFLTLLVFLTDLGCSSNEIENLPPGVLGCWETTTPKFEGFTFELSKETITFTDLNAETPVEYYLIQKRTKDLDKKKNVYYTVHYENKEGLEFPFAFYFNPSGGGKIRLKNQKRIVWTRSEPL